MMMVAHLMAALIFEPMDETRIYGVTVRTPKLSTEVTVCVQKQSDH